jgi:hypothetical protein
MLKKASDLLAGGYAPEWVHEAPARRFLSPDALAQMTSGVWNVVLRRLRVLRKQARNGVGFDGLADYKIVITVRNAGDGLAGDKHERYSQAGSMWEIMTDVAKLGAVPSTAASSSSNTRQRNASSNDDTGPTTNAPQ